MIISNCHSSLSNPSPLFQVCKTSRAARAPWAWATWAAWAATRRCPSSGPLSTRRPCSSPDTPTPWWWPTGPWATRACPRKDLPTTRREDTSWTYTPVKHHLRLLQQHMFFSSFANVPSVWDMNCERLCFDADWLDYPSTTQVFCFDDDVKSELDRGIDVFFFVCV